MVTESVNCDASYFRIFAGDIIFFDHRLHACAHCFFKRALPGYGRKSLCFSTTPFFSAPGFNALALGAVIPGLRLALFCPRALRGFGWMPGSAKSRLSRGDCDEEKQNRYKSNRSVDRKHFGVFLISFWFASSVDERWSQGGEKILRQKRTRSDERRGILPADDAITALEQRPEWLGHLVCHCKCQLLRFDSAD
jgi:hypothetical protein